MPPAGTFIGHSPWLVHYNWNYEIRVRIAGNVGQNELLSQLIQVVDMFTEQQTIEHKEEEQRAAREMIKVEQDEAYQQSLEVDRCEYSRRRKEHV